MVDAKITVEIVYARPGEQTLEQLRVPAAATVRDVITTSGILERFPETDLLLLDDGFQHRRLHRDLDLVVLDAPHLFDRPGNPYLAPDGGDWPDNWRRLGNCPSRSRRSIVAVDMATTWATVGRSMKMGVMGIFFALMLHSPSVPPSRPRS